MSAPSPAGLLPPPADYVGLAPFLRASIAGADLLAVGQALLQHAQANPDDPAALLNLATALFSLGNRDFGLVVQREALSLQRSYRLPARRQPAACRLLLLMAPGDVAANTPLQCLLEDADIDLIEHYLDPAQPSLAGLPAHDLLLVAVGEGEPELLAWLAAALADWPVPVLNRPAAIARLSRDSACALLRDLPGVLMPATREVTREQLADLAAGRLTLDQLAPGQRFPQIVRPCGSHAGRDLERVAGPAELAAYLARVADARFFLADFVDYSGADGLFRKARVVIVDGRPFVAHMAVSAHWMVHYVNAGMYVDAARRAEEAAFMAGFVTGFAARHRAALAAIAQRCALDYLALDCAETADGRLLVFEVDTNMVVHAMDLPELFPYKPAAIALIVDAFRRLLVDRLAGVAA